MMGILLIAAVLLPFARTQDGSPARQVGGDPLKVEFTLPFEKALEKAKAGKRLLFVKPIYGGVDKAGAKDYRCGKW